jgi:hypothetical protein
MLATFLGEFEGVVDGRLILTRILEHPVDEIGSGFSPLLAFGINGAE